MNFYNLLIKKPSQGILGYFLMVLAILIGSSDHLWAAQQTHRANSNQSNADERPFQVLMVRTNHTYKAKTESLKQQAKKYQITVDSRSVSELEDITEASRLFSQFDLVLFDGASKSETKKEFEKFAPVVQQSKGRFVALKWFDSDSLSKNVERAMAERLFQYYDNGGQKNFARMASFIRNRLWQNTLVQVDAPIIYPEVGIYHPEYENLIFSNYADFATWNHARSPAVPGKKPEAQAVIGIMMQRALVESSQTEVIDATLRAFESRGATVIPFFFEVSANASPYQHLITRNNQSIVDVMVNFRTIHWANQRKSEFEEIGVPIVQALTYYDGDQQDWENDAQGISPGMTPFLLVLPETAGVIGPQIVAARNKLTEASEVIDYQLEHLVNKTLNYARLKHKPNQDKKLAVFFWGDRDMGASFLNVPDSLHVISRHLNQQGYNINPVEPEFFTDRVVQILDPFFRDYQLNQLIDDGLADLMPVDEYLLWFNQLPDSVTEPINQKWGQAQDNFMVVERDGVAKFVIPRIINGNMMVMRQPPRADDKDQDKMLYHKGEVPMNHYYLAAYYYARNYWKSDAIIHLGTHGSQEYLGGKERGLSRYDGPNLAVWDTPVFYPFIVDDVGEAMQTKRRGSATVISHMTPPFAAAGLQGDSADIHELMHQYHSLDQGGVKVKTARQIVQKCVESNICRDFGWSEDKIQTDFAGFLASLHDYLGELAAENQPLGLHSFGELAEKSLMVSTLLQMMKPEFVRLAAEFERENFLNKAHQHPEGREQAHDAGYGSQTHNSGGHFHQSEAEVENLAGYQTVKKLIVEPMWASVAHLAHESSETHTHHENGQAPHPENGEHSHPEGVTANSSESEANLDQTLDELSDELKSHILAGRKLFSELTAIKELDNLVAGLSGEYIPVKTGGDPIRHPESVPTGFNLYGFDPAKLPTKAAFEQGKELVEQVIQDYYLEHKKYPDKLAFSLWSIEAMRHYGVLESQALYAMGVRPKWSSDGRVVGTEIIPASELKRPRVDVVLSATGLYRDAFPDVVQRLAKAIEQIAQLKEDNNSIWENTERIKKNLVAQGYAEDEALYLSSIRIFSNASGQYGSGTDGPVFASDTWQTDAKISDHYLSNMGYAFGTDPNRWGEQIEGLSLYAKQLSGTDVAMFSRSSNIYGMLSSDDPFEYFGSLALAVRNIDGKSPKMMITNLRDASKGQMEDAAMFLAKELRTRQFHQRWLQEMQKEGYSGAVTMAAQVANFWGWQVVDPNLVRADQWQEFHEIYVEDKLNLDLNQWFEQVNPGAQAQLIETMLEAVRKNYWQASAQTQRKLIERYLEIVERFDWFVDNEKLKEFVNQSAAGYGLNVAALEQNAGAQPVTEAQNRQKPQSQQIEGQQLEKVEENASEKTWPIRLIIALVLGLLVFSLGALTQANKRNAFQGA